MGLATDSNGTEGSETGFRRLLFPQRVWGVACFLMILLAVAWLSYQSYRYFAVPKVVNGRTISEGGIDLHNRYLETQSWFQGKPVYKLFRDGVYAPASYAIFGIVFNKMPWGVVKVLWYLLSLAMIALLSWELTKHAKARSKIERWFLGLMPFAFYATGAAIGNGQLIPFVLPLVLYAVLILTRPVVSKKELSVGSVFMVTSLVQPTIAAPFFWLVLLRSPRWSRGGWVVAAYAVLTLFAVVFQMRTLRGSKGQADPAGLVKRWVAKAEGGTHYGSIKGGYGTVHDLFSSLGLRSWNLWVSLVILVLLGIWIYRHRHVDLWVLLGATAIVARMWIYHRWYDDLLFLLPLICLFRITRSPQYSLWEKNTAGVLFLWLWAFLLAPGILYTISSNLLLGVQISGWLATLLFFGLIAWRSKPESEISAESMAHV